VAITIALAETLRPSSSASVVRPANRARLRTQTPAGIFSTDPSKLPSDPVVFHADLVLAIEPLEPAYREMTPGHVLEVLDERIVHRGASEGADDRKRLRQIAARAMYKVPPRTIRAPSPIRNILGLSIYRYHAVSPCVFSGSTGSNWRSLPPR
jgi:hypothetical protein